MVSKFSCDVQQEIYGVDFLVTNTNAWYGNPEITPSIESFRDMISAGQLHSKLWLLDVLKLHLSLNASRVLVVGSWMGSLCWGITRVFPNINVVGLDIDAQAIDYCQKVYVADNYTFICGDMYDYDYSNAKFDLVVNTACEHISDLNGWLNLLPKGTEVILQSNNFYQGEGHIGCVDNCAEFINQAKLQEIHYAATLPFHMYDRYMLLGKT